MEKLKDAVQQRENCYKHLATPRHHRANPREAQRPKEIGEPLDTMHFRKIPLLLVLRAKDRRFLPNWLRHGAISLRISEWGVANRSRILNIKR